MNTATPASTETLIEEFRVDVPQADVDDLAERLGRTRWPAALPGAAWERGALRRCQPAALGQGTSRAFQ